MAADAPCFSSAPDSSKESLGGIENVCGAMLKVADEIESLHKRIHHLATDLRGRSETHTDMRDYLGSTNRGGRKPKHPLPKPFHGITKLEQFDVLQKIYNLRMELTFKFEALRQVQIAGQKCQAVKKALALENSNMSTDPEEAKYLEGMLEEQVELSRKIIEIEKQRMDLAVSAVSHKTRIAELYELASSEVKDIEDDSTGDEDEEERNNENAATNNQDPEERMIKQRTRKLKTEEAKVNQMRHLIQKLMFSMPNNSQNFDDLINKEHEDMMCWCGQEPSVMRGDK